MTAPRAPADATSRVVEVADGTRLHVQLWDPVPVPGGSGEAEEAATGTAAFLLVHGLASNARLWDGVARGLAAAGHRVAAVDQRAHGRSDPSDDLTLPTLLADLRAVTAACDLDRPIAVGQSWGGNVVLELARCHPDLVRGVACLDGGTIELADTFPDADACWGTLAPPRWDRGVTHDAVRAQLAETHPDWPEEGRSAQLGNLAVRPDGTVTAILTRERHRAILTELWAHRPHRMLAEVRTPVLLLPVDTGEAGWTDGKRSGVERAQARLPRARTRWFHGRDHDVHAQAPTEVVEVLLAAVADGFLTERVARP